MLAQGVWKCVCMGVEVSVNFYNLVAFFIFLLTFIYYFANKSQSKCQIKHFFMLSHFPFIQGSTELIVARVLIAWTW